MNATPSNSAPVGAPTLQGLQLEFPQFAMWRETRREPARYVARRTRYGIHPHTVVTADISELHAILTEAAIASEHFSRRASKSA